MSWGRFWHAERSTAWLALFRVLFAGCLLKELSTTKAKAIAAIATDAVRVPYVSWIPHVHGTTYDWIHWAQIPLIAWLAIGWRHRIPAAALVVLQGWILFADYMNFRNHPYFFWLVTLILVLAPAGETLSPRMWARRRAGWREAWIGPDRPVTFQRLIQVQLCLVYFFAGLHKLNPSFLRGEVLARNLSNAAESGHAGLWKLLGEERSARAAEWLAEAGNVQPMAWSSVAVELLLPIALWIRPLRRWAILVGIGFHLSIAETMAIRVFSWAMIAGYLLFLDPPRRSS